MDILDPLKMIIICAPDKKDEKIAEVVAKGYKIVRLEAITRNHIHIVAEKILKPKEGKDESVKR